ncbi:ABC transporter substrate-binding protein [Nocardioides sp.]|uniref:ABC transporter substrate-binding protein n=1 Tax=Nocardioides sp. TaxID=35761 RepID=UPI003512CDA8
MSGSLTDPLPADLPEAVGVVVTEDDGTRTVRSAWGTVEVPQDPQRIVSVIGDLDFESMLALGVVPVAAGTQGGSAASGFAPHLGDLADGVTPLAWSDGAPVERIAALRPDLIFAPDEETAQQLAAIAPTVPRGSWDPTRWKEDFRYVAQVLGCEEEGAARLAVYEDDAAALRADLAAAVPDVAELTVASPQVGYDHAQIGVAGRDQLPSQVFAELGLTLDDLVTEAEDPWEVGLSFERMAELDADLLFWQVRQDETGAPDEEGLALATGNPLYRRLPAVRAGAVTEVPNRPWYFPTILGAERILADVRAALIPG